MARPCPTGKLKHTRSDALREMARLISSEPAHPSHAALNVYRCDVCGRHHIGHRGRRIDGPVLPWRDS